MKALILGGGGARGSFEAGVAISLLKHEDFDLVCGASIGAINGSLVAQGELEKLEDLWRTVAQHHVIRLAPEIDALVKIAVGLERLSKDPLPQRAGAIVELFKNYTALGSPSELKHLLGALASQPVADLLGARLNYDALKRSLIISATNITRSRPEAFFNFLGRAAPDATARFTEREPNAHQLTQQTYLPAVCASAAIPGAFPPVIIADPDGTQSLYLDGGVTTYTPMGDAIKAGAVDVTVVHMDRPDMRPPKPLASIPDIALVVQDIRQQRMLDMDLKLARSINAAVLAGHAPGRRFVSIRTISPQAPLGVSVLQFDDQERIDAAFEQGKRDGERIAALAS